MALEYFFISVGTIALASIPVILINAIEAIEEIRRRLQSTEDDDDENRKNLFDIFQDFVLHCDEGAVIYVCHEIYLNCRKYDMLDFIPDMDGNGVVCYYYGRQLIEDANEPMFRAEKE